MKKIIYQILPRIWGNGTMSCCDMATLDYLRSLGVDYVWYTGIPRHAAGKDFVKGDPGSPYAISDWMDVNPYLAGDPAERMVEFSSLVERTHAAGLKLIIDYIPNHVARDYSGKIVHYDWCDGDWTDTLKNNWDAPETMEAMLEILRFWASRGVDGFRCDMVELVDPGKLGSLIEAVKSEYPELIFVAEVYGRHNYRRYLDAGFDLLYDKCGLYDALVGICRWGHTAESVTWNWQFLGDMQPRMLNFLENHDELRLASKAFLGSPEKAYAALAVSMLFNDAWFMLYAGQEVGEDASESPDGRTSIFNWCHPKMLGDLYAWVHGERELDAHEAAVSDKYGRLLDLAGRPVFRSGKCWDLCYCNRGSAGFDPQRHFAFLRYDSSETWLIVCNFSGAEADIDVNFPADLSSVVGGRKSVRLSVPAWDSTAVRLQFRHGGTAA